MGSAEGEGVASTYLGRGSCFFHNFEKYKIYTLFWYQVYPNRRKTKETMIFFLFSLFSRKDLFVRKKALSQKKKLK